MKKITEAPVILLIGTMMTAMLYWVTFVFPSLTLFFLVFLPASFGIYFKVFVVFTAPVIPGALFAGFSSASYKTGSIIGMGSGILGFVLLMVAVYIINQSSSTGTLSTPLASLAIFSLPVVIVSFGLGAFGVMLAKRLKPAWKQWVAS